jgi:MYXO-CTERM domain-containing protein
MSSAELFDPATKTWASTGSMGSFAVYAQLFSAGGTGDPALMVYGLNARYYLPSTGTWGGIGPLTVSRHRHAAAYLPATGKILVVGGGSATAEIFDPKAAKWSVAGSMSSDRVGAGAAALGNNIVIVGGADPTTGNAVRTTDVFDTLTGTWSVGSPMASARIDHVTVSYGSFGVAVIGGHTGTTGGLGVTSAELFNGSTWSINVTTPDDFFAAWSYAPAGLFVTGGVHATGSTAYAATTDAVLYTGTTGSALPSITTARYGHTATLVDDTTVVVAGGATGWPTATAFLSSTEVYVGDANGATCTTGSTCAYGYCNAGKCDCPLAAASTCGFDGTKDSTGKCNKFTTTTTCSPPTCGLGILRAASICDGKGHCVPGATSSCPTGYGCASSSACATACIDDTTCATGYWCKAAACIAQAANGAACVAGHECLSGFCVDGVCCDAACTSGCDACTAAKKGSGVDGTCDHVAADTDPNNVCSPDIAYPTSCKEDGMCDGSGRCRKYAKIGIACGATSCTAGTVTGKTCDGGGGCSATPKPCAPYTCDSDACKTSCAAETDCSSDAYCNLTTSTCATKKGPGESCTDVKECAKGYCVDGVCCDSTCGDSCQACNTADNKGRCVPINGSPVGTKRPPCAGTGTCGGTCNGVSPSCTYPPATTACGSTCAAGSETKSTCDAAGACVAGSATSCGAYVCGADGKSCRTACDTDTDCATGYGCGVDKKCSPKAGSKCSDDGTESIAADGTHKPCAPFVCNSGTGVCNPICTTSADCASSYTCNSTTKTCDPTNPDPSPSGGCGCATVGGSTTPTSALFVGALAVLGLAARRRVGGRVCDRRRSL